jgi:competence protein ComEC
MTSAATLATAPLIAFHFESISTTTLFANLLALPAVAPAMWLGMLSAASGQIPGFPVAVLNAIGAPLFAYIAQIAAWCGQPSWASLHVRLGLGGLLVSYLALVVAAIIAAHLSRQRRLAAVRRGSHDTRRRSTVAVRFLFRIARQRANGRRLPLVAALALSALLVLLLLVLLLPGAGGPSALVQPVGLRVSVLDVGQGDAILLQPREAPAVLVDGGPPGDGIAAKLRSAGVDRLGAAIVTHDQADHAGGIRELLGTLPIGHILYAVLRRSTLGQVRANGISTRRLARGEELRSGSLRLEVLWPPRELLIGSHRGEDPNQLAIVALARWRRFAMLLTADAEAEAVPLDPGPIDVLKVAHHGSDDAGLGALLDRARPRLAVISVGAGNPFGHPAPATLAVLAAHGIRTLRTDRDGTIVLEVSPDSIEVTADG